VGSVWRLWERQRELAAHGFGGGSFWFGWSASGPWGLAVEDHEQTCVHEILPGSRGLEPARLGLAAEVKTSK
jgi:hypothetical protein